MARRGVCIQCTFQINLPLLSIDVCLMSVMFSSQTLCNYSIALTAEHLPHLFLSLALAQFLLLGTRPRKYRLINITHLQPSKCENSHIIPRLTCYHNKPVSVCRLCD